MGGGGRIVGEVGSDDNGSDTQGVGVSRTANRRFPSDPLRFTGIDLGDDQSRHLVRRAYTYKDPGDEDEQGEDDDEDDDDDDSSSDYDNDEYEHGAQLAGVNKEEALVQAALARIRRAQERGRQEVKLNKQELAALERRRKRLQEEEEARRASERKKRKQKEQRISIPLSQLAPTVTTIHKKKSSSSGSSGSKKSPASSDDDLPRHPSPASIAEMEEQEPLPPMGFFPPPNTARSRPRSSTSTTQRPPSRAMEEYESSSLHYPDGPSISSYLQTSDTTSDSRPRSSRSYLPPDDAAWASGSMSTTARSAASYSVNRPRSTLDPFMYQTEGPRAPDLTDAGAVSQRFLPSLAESQRASVVDPAAARSGRGSRRPSPGTPEETVSASDTSDPDTSDDLGNGVQIVEPPRRGGRREEIVVEEEEPVILRRSMRNKKPANSSPVKKKSSSSWGRKKKK